MCEREGGGEGREGCMRGRGERRRVWEEERGGGGREEGNKREEGGDSVCYNMCVSFPAVYVMCDPHSIPSSSHTILSFHTTLHYCTTIQQYRTYCTIHTVFTCSSPNHGTASVLVFVANVAAAAFLVLDGRGLPSGV